VTLIRARAALPQARRAQFDRRLAELRVANGEAVALAEVLRVELSETGAIEQTRRLVEEFLETCETAANIQALPEPLAHGMHELLDLLRAQYFSLA
jgi:hypothetical protein